MKNRLLVFLTVILMMVFIHPFYGQQRAINSEKKPNQIEGFNKEKHTSNSSSAPMVIGPDLYNQMGENSGYYIVNSNYNKPEFEAFDAFAADDFVIPEGETWEIKYIRNLIYSQGSTDSITSFDVYFYADNNGKPGNIVEEVDEVADAYFNNEAAGYGYISEVTLTLPITTTLNAGKYWLCVQANNFSTANNVYNQPSYWSGIIPQPGEISMYSDAHFKQPGGGFYPFYDWTSATDYSPVFGGEPGIPYMPNYNFGVYGPAVNNDLALADIFSPSTGGALSQQETVTVLIQNHGLNNIASAVVRFRVDGSSWITEETGAINSGEELIYSFHDPADLSIVGEHIVDVELLFDDDEFVSNNTLSTTVTNYGTILPAVANGSVEYSVCEGTFTDHGGLNDPSVSYSQDTVIFYSPDSRKRIRLEFYDTQMSGAYAFRFYDGMDTNASELGEWEALNNDEGVFTQEIPGLVIEGVNARGAITVLPPGFDTGQTNVNNFMAKVTCVDNKNYDFKIMKLETSKDFSWEKETIKLTATIKSRGLENSSQLVTFYANDTEIETVSTTTLTFGETTKVSTHWTPETAGIYTLKAQVPDDEGAYANEKYVEVEKEIFEQGKIVEGFESETYPPLMWESKVTGASNRGFIWYNSRPNYQGKWYAQLNGDTLVMPRMNIQNGDKLQFIYDAGYFSGTCNILYAENRNGPWTTFHTVDYAWPWSTEYTVDLSSITGIKYLAFNGSGCSIDYVRGPKQHFYENDLMITTFSGVDDPQVNEETYYTVEVKNIGSADLNPNNYSVKLWGISNNDTTELVSMPGVAITLSNNYVFKLPITFTQPQDMVLFATIAFADDQDITNNKSVNKPIAVIKAGVEYVYLGNSESELNDYATLAAYPANYTEVVYKAEDLRSAGEISGISIYYRSSYLKNYKIKLFIGETSADGLADGFLSTSVMDEVYFGEIKAQPTNGAYVQQYIAFDKPYLYSGNNNLVLGFYHPYNGEDFSGSIYLQATETNYVAKRWRGFQLYEVATDISDPDVLNSMTANTYNDAPNVTFYIKTTNIDAHLAGTVKDENAENYQGALIELDGFANTALTDANGQYAFPVMPVGDVDVRVSAYGYYSDTATGTFTSGNQTRIDFNLQKLPPVKISGKVLGNDLQQSLTNVSVTVMGYGLEMSGLTDENGDFSITNLYADKTYRVTFEHPRYETFIDTVFIPIEGIDVGNVVLDEVETPAFNFIAKVNDDESVALSWQAPYSGVDHFLDPTLGFPCGAYWYNEPDEDVQLGNLFRVEEPGTVTAIEFTNYAWPGAVSGELYLRFYNKEREEIMEPVPFIMPDTAVDWAVVEVPNFTYTDDFYVMIHWDRVHEQTAAIMSHQHDDNVAYLIDQDGNWMLLSDVVGSQYGGAFSIKAKVLESSSKTGTKELVSYDIWRSKLSDIDNEDNWVKLNDEAIAGSTGEITYTDETFANAEADFYAYILQTQYTISNAPYMYSNSLQKGMFAGVSISVSSNNEQETDGAHVILENQNGADINRYEADVVDGKVEFPNVRKGTYDLTITKGAAFEVYEAENIVIEENKQLQATLLEVIFNPVMPRITVNQENREAYFSWGLGSENYLMEDDGTFEQSLSVSADGEAALGNYFNVDASGQIYNVEIYGVLDNGNNPENEMGMVNIAIYNANQELIGQSEPFSIQPDSLFNVAVDFVQFSGPFYVMVQWSASETLNTHALAVDTDSDPGVAFWNDAEYGFVQLAEWGYYGNFGIRTQVLINGKKSTVTPLAVQPVNVDKPLALTNQSIAKTAGSGNKSVLSYNVFLNNAQTPLATGITEQNFTFTAEHFNAFADQTEFEAGVQAVFFSDNSLTVWLDSAFHMPLGVMDELNAKLQVYPNPAKAEITIENAHNATISIFNATGTLVKTVAGNAINHTIDVTALESGTYVLQFEFEQGTIYRNMVITK